MQRSTRPTLVCVGAIGEARNALVAAVLEYVCHNCSAATHGIERAGAATIAALRAEAERHRNADIGRRVADEQVAAWAFDSEYAEGARASREQERSERIVAAQASIEESSAELAEDVRQWTEVGQRAEFVRDQYPNVREEALRRHRSGDAAYEAARQARDDVDAAAMNLLRAKGLCA